MNIATLKRLLPIIILFILMLCSAAVILRAMVACAKRKRRVSFTSFNLLIPSVIFVLLCAVNGVLIYITPINGADILQSKPAISQEGDTEAFSTGLDDILTRYTEGNLESGAAQAEFEQLTEKYLTDSDAELYTIAKRELEAADRISHYIAALESGNYSELDKLIRFYYEDYMPNSLKYKKVPEYRLISFLSQNKTLQNNTVALDTVDAKISGYIDYCLQCPATKTRFEIVLNLYYMLMDLGFDNKQAADASQKANKALRVLATEDVSVAPVDDATVAAAEQ